MKKKKGFSVSQLGSLAMAIVVATIVISMGGAILGDLQVQQCDYTWGTYNETYVGTETTGTFCCQTVNDSDSNHCQTAYEGDTAANVTGYGISGMSTFGSWLPLIVLVIVAAVIIGIIYTYLGGGRAGGI